MDRPRPLVLEHSRQRQRRSKISIYLDASGLVVSMVGRNYSGSDCRVAKSGPAARTFVCRSVAVDLDGGRVCAPHPDWPTTGLLFDEHVERVRHFRGDGMGKN